MIWMGSAFPPRRRLALPLVTAALAVLGIALIALGTDPARSGPGAAPAARQAGIGVPAKTGYGWVTVTHVERIRGLTAKDLSGMTHGVQNLVESDQVLVAVGVTLTNAQKTTLKYGPGMFRVQLGGPGGATVPALASQIGPGVLQPDSGIELILNFVVPSGGSRLSVLATDGSGHEVAIPIGKSVRGLPGGENHSH